MHKLRLFTAAVVAACFLVSGCSKDTTAKQLERGNAYMDKRDYVRAILEFKNAMHSAPRDAEPHYRMALATLETGDMRSAIVLLRKALNLDSKHVGAQLKLVELMAFSRNPERIREAAKRAQDVVAFMPDATEGLKLLAITEWRLGKTEDAAKHLEEALRRSPDHLQSIVTLAWMKLGQKQIAEAEQLLKHAVDRAEGTTAPLTALGRFYVLTNRWAEAEEQFRAVCEREPQNGDALVDLARVQMEHKNLPAAEATFRRAASLPDKKLHVLLPLFLYQNGRHEEAVAELKKMLEVDAGDRTARSLLVSAYLQRNQVQAAEELLKIALDRNGKDIQARLQRARIHLFQDRPAEAQVDLREVLNFEPGSAEAHYLMAKVHAVRGESMLERQELNSAIQSDATLLAARIDLSRHLIAGRDPKSALQIMNDVPKNQRRMLQTIVQRNWALMATNNHTEARQWIHKVLATARVPDLLLQDAVLKLSANDLPGARKSLEETLTLQPGDVRAIQALAGSYLMRRESAKALSIVREHAAKQPRSAPVQALAGRWLLDAGDLEGARRAYSVVRDVEASAAAIAELRLAEIDQMAGNLDAARRRLTVLASSPSASAAVFYTLGNIEENSNNREAAIRHYRKAIELESRHVWALNNLAFLLVEHEQSPDEALKYAQKAMEALPNNHIIEDTLGWVYYQKGIYATAIMHLENAVARGKDAGSQYRLAVAYAKAGRRKQAAQTMQAALRAAPDRPEAAMARAVLDSIQNP